MSSLTEQERLGLEEVFLSISSSDTLMRKWSSHRQPFDLWAKVGRFVSPLVFTKRSHFWLKKSFKPHKFTKLFSKKEKRRKI